MELADWLRQLGLEQYETGFRNNDITPGILADLTADDLRELGVASIGHRRQLLSAIAALRPNPPAIQPPEADQPALPESQGERRQVAVLFADISGYTALAVRQDPEETHRVLGRFFEAVDTTVARFGGAVERHIGDNVMGVFGAPVAHGNDPLRAVMASMEIHRVLTEVSAVAGVPLAVHIGIAGGEVMASQTGSTLRAAYGVVGSPVNLAARIQAQTPAGATYVSDAVRAAVAATVELAPMGPLSFKGIEEPIAIWRVIGLRPEPAHENVLPFVGRRAELDLLAATLDAVTAGGGGRALQVRGEAGIGKTRLMHAARRLASERGFTCLQALILDFGMARGHEAVRTLVEGLLGLPPLAVDAARRDSVASAITRRDVAAADEVYLNDLLHLNQPPALRTLFDAMDAAERHRGRQRVTAALVHAVSTRTPLFLLIEDIHWADGETLDALAALAGAIAEHRCLLVMTSRIDGDPIDAAWRSKIRTGLATLDLGPLRSGEVAAFGEHLRIANDLFLARCIERAGGNPLFLEQLLRNTAEGSSTEDVPASVQSLVLARLDRLPAAEKQALQAASVVGQRFSHEILCLLLGDAVFVPDLLIQQQMIQREGSEYLFAHALVRDAVYSSVTRQRRQLLHRRAAEWYASRDLVLHAEHLERAADPDAPMAYHAAAQAELAGYRWARALALAERGRAIATRPQDCFAHEALAGDCLRDMGNPTASLARYETALAAAPDDTARCRALIGLAAARRILSQAEPALAALDAAEPLAKSGDLRLELAQIHQYRGSMLFSQGHTERCLAAHEAALAAAESVDNAEWRIRALSGIGDATYSVCRMRTARDAFERCVQLCDAHGLGRIALPNRIMVAHCLLYLEQVPAAVALLEEAREAAVRISNPYVEMFAAQSLGVVLTQSGQCDAASECLQVALETSRSLGAQRYEANILTLQAEARLVKGARAEAHALARNAVDLARATGLGFTGPYSLAVLAHCTEDADERRKALTEGEATLGKGSVGHNQIWFRRVAAEVLLETGDNREAVRHAAELRKVTQGEPLPYTDFIANRIDALATEGVENPTAVEALVSHAEAMGYLDFAPALICKAAALRGAGVAAT